jgi:hypothetical protein
MSPCYPTKPTGGCALCLRQRSGVRPGGIVVIDGSVVRRTKHGCPMFVPCPRSKA